MSADFWAGYLSGAIGILVGNPLDLIKVRLQAQGSAKPAASSPILPSSSPTPSPSSHSTPSTPTPTAQQPSTRFRDIHNLRTLLRGLPAPILTYGALNALLFTTYNRSLAVLSPGSSSNGDSNDTTITPSPFAHFAAGTFAGLATFVLSAPTELVKCRAQVAEDAVAVQISTNNNRTSSARSSGTSSWAIFTQTLRNEGLRGLYHGGVITSVRDAVGYGFYFWTYEVTRGYFEGESKTGMNALRRGEDLVNIGAADVGAGGAWYQNDTAKALLCGGLAGVATWASIFPLDVIKTRVQTQSALLSMEPGAGRRTIGTIPSGGALASLTTPLVSQQQQQKPKRLGAMETARLAYRAEGVNVFFRGLTVCCVRAFIVNAVQWAVYEWVMGVLLK